MIGRSRRQGPLVPEKLSTPLSDDRAGPNPLAPAFTTCVALIGALVFLENSGCIKKVDVVRCPDGTYCAVGYVCEPLQADDPSAGYRCNAAGCGNGLLEPGEDCDLGDRNSDAPDSACRTDCTKQRCGDGIVDSGKGAECDDGLLWWAR